MLFRSDTSALERDFGYKPSTSLREGLRKFAEYGQLKTGKRNEAVTLSVRPMLDKIAGALSNGIVGFVVVAAGMVGNATAADMTAANIRTFKTCAYYLPLAGIVASLVVFLLTVKIDENMHAHIVEQLEGRLASEEADKQ